MAVVSIIDNFSDDNNAVEGFEEILEYIESENQYRDFPLYITDDSHMPPEHLYYKDCLLYTSRCV